MGLKKLVKKIKKGVKKVLKSPIGRIAAPAAAMYFGGPALAGALGGGAAGATGAGALIGAGTQKLTGGDWRTGALLGGMAGYGANQYGLLGGAPEAANVSGLTNTPQEVFRAGEIAAQNAAPTWGGLIGKVGSTIAENPRMSTMIAGGLLGGMKAKTENEEDATDYGPAMQYNFPQMQMAQMQAPQANPYIPPLARRGNENSGAWRFGGGYGAS